MVVAVQVSRLVDAAPLLSRCPGLEERIKLVWMTLEMLRGTCTLAENEGWLEQVHMLVHTAVRENLMFLVYTVTGMLALIVAAAAIAGTVTTVATCRDSLVNVGPLLCHSTR